MTFDALAPTYDHDFTAQPFAQALRARVHEKLLRYFHTRDHVLELACGTGEDALFLAQHGIRVTATDASVTMLNIARAKLSDQPLVSIDHLDFQRLPSDYANYSGVFSNFGGLNCLGDWRPLARWLADRLPVGGIAAFGVMSPFCLWEMAWHSAHCDFKTAFRRWRGASFQPDPTATPSPIHYPTVRRLTRDFAPYFARVSVEPLGLVIPPSDVYAMFDKHPRWRDRLITLDRRLSFSPLALLADHYWIVFRRTAA